MRQHVASFANFVCKFGAQKSLLDYASEIVLPAFTDDSLIRSYGKRTHYFFYETEVGTINIDDEDIVIVSGRFIKNTELTREQIFDPDKGLVKDESSISSAPSAFFVLMLNNHRLIYFPETAHAPDLSAFRVTAERFLRTKHKTYIDSLYKELNSENSRDGSTNNNQRTTKTALLESHPQPNLEVIPISGDDQIESFVRRYSVLKKVEFRVLETNDETDGGEVFEDIREFLRPLNPTNTKLITRNSEGLDVEKAIPRIKIATETDNQEIRLSGLDHSGNKLTGDNHEFKIGAPIDNIPPTRKGLTRKLIKVFNSLRSSGAIKTGINPSSVKEKITKLIEIL